MTYCCSSEAQNEVYAEGNLNGDAGVLAYIYRRLGVGIGERVDYDALRCKVSYESQELASSLF